MDIILIYANTWRLIDGELFMLAAALFFAGIFFAPIVVRKNVKLLLWYPLWVWRKLKGHVDPGTPFLRLWALIFSLNSLSLFCNLVAGFFIILPFLFALLLGIHIGVLVLKEMGSLKLILLILNPVSLFELPAAWISLALGMRFGVDLYLVNFTKMLYLFEQTLMGYFLVVLPLLAIAGFIEVSLIKALGKRAINDSGLEAENEKGQNRTLNK
jgi:uncharacterized membrane protein SpoIIM required for sporulation